MKRLEWRAVNLNLRPRFLVGGLLTYQVGGLDGKTFARCQGFRSLGVLFRSDKAMEREMDRRFRSQVVNQTMIYCSVYVLTLSHELWVVTKRTSSWTQGPKMS